MQVFCNVDSSEFVHAGSIVVNIATYLLQNNELFAVSSQDDDFLCFNPFC